MEHGRTHILLREAIASAKAGNKAWARECLERILKDNPRHEEAWLWLSTVLDTPAEKRYCLEKALTINPHSAQARAGLRYLEQPGRIPVQPVVQPKRTLCPMCGEPNDPKAFQCANCGQDLFVRCPSCGERVDIDRPSCANCGLEIGRSDDGAAYFFHLGELYLQYGQPKRALETWDKTLFLNPNYPGIAEVAAAAFLATGQRDLAIQSMVRAIEEAPDEEHKRALRLKLAGFHRDLGNHQEALQLYQELLQEEKEHREAWPDLYVEMGRFQQKLGALDEARNYYEMALVLDDSLHEVHYDLAEILLEEGYELRALNEFRLLQEVEGEVGERARARILELRPPVPEAFRNRWQETVRGTARFALAGLILLVLVTRREWMDLSVQRVLGLFLSIVGGYLFTAATATPRNLPTLAALTRIGDHPTLARLRLRRKKGKTDSKKPSALGRFADSQRRSVQRAAAQLRVMQVRWLQALHRAVASISRRLEQFKRTPLGKRIAQTGARLGRSRFFSAAGRTLRRLFPRQAGLLTRLGRFLGGGSKRLVEQAGKVEIDELQIYRWIAAVLGIFLLILAGRLILL